MPLNIANSTLYGKGVFTTLAIYDGDFFLWDKHWRRLRDNASYVDIDLAEFSEDLTKNSLADAVSKNNLINGRARLTFFDESGSTIWDVKDIKKTSLSIITGDWRPLPDNVRLAISPYPVNSRSPLAGVKSCNYLEKILALDEAKERGFDEVIQVNERGEITSAAMANVFWLKGGTLYTPRLATGCLAGTTREFILENLDCREVEEPIEKLHSADEIFLSSAGLGVMQINEFESRKLACVDHPILHLIPKA